MTSSIPDLVVPLRVQSLMAYGAATWDWHPMHYDSAAARAAGMAGPVVDGQMFGALIARQIRAWAGPRARFLELRFRNCGFVTAPCDIIIMSEVSTSRQSSSHEQLGVNSRVTDHQGRVVVDNAFTLIEVPL